LTDSICQHIYFQQTSTIRVFDCWGSEWEVD
jgi:hypothetical protein